jgi:hypothetical protein
LCDISHIKLDSKKTSNLLDTLDDLMAANLQRQFQLMKGKVDASDLGNLDLWLSDRHHELQNARGEETSSTGDFAMNQIIESNCKQFALSAINQP